MKNQEIQKADTRKSTNLLKKHLKSIFGIDFKIRSEYYSMGCSLNISYTLGPDKSEVEKIVKNLQYGGFDSMTDCSYIVDNAGLVIDGYQLEEFKHVFVRQEFPESLKFKLAKFISDNKSYQGVDKLESEDQMHTNFNERFGSAWNWSDMVYQMVKLRNFVTQDESKINLISVHESEMSSEGYYFIYSVDGVTYSTKEYGVAQKEATPELVEVPVGTVQVIEYSAKAIAVIGDTKSIKEKLKELGGKFNYHLSCGPGWIFPKTKLNDLQASLTA